MIVEVYKVCYGFSGKPGFPVDELSAQPCWNRGVLVHADGFPSGFHRARIGPYFAA
ncbi:MAG: hypothetical protein ACPLSM_06615 [Thermosphaera sp.]